MANIGYILSTVAMGLLTLGIAVTVVRVSTRRQRPETAGERSRRANREERDVLERYGAVLGAATRNPTTWYVGFFVLVFGFVGGAIALVTSSPEVGSLVFLGLGLAFAAVLCAFLVWGIYSSGRSHGLRSAQAAMAGAWAIGSLLVVAISVKLITASP